MTGSSFDATRFVRPEIMAMAAYKPISPREHLARRLGLPAEEIVLLDANENPYGPSPRALESIAAGQDYHRYPDPQATSLRQALAAYTGLDQEHILAGAGADELIDLILRAVLQPGDGVIDCPPSFGMYPFATAVNGGRSVAVPRRRDFSLDMAGIEAAVDPRTRVIFICSPNNPDGGLVDDGTLRRLLRLPLLVILDEAYVEFAGPSRLPWVLDFPNLAVLRTCSKLAGLAGLRVGYGAFPTWLMPHLWKIRQPYNVNAAASRAAVAALSDRAWLEEKTAAIVAERARLYAALAAMSFLKPLPSRANFILCRVGHGAALKLRRALEVRGIMVRHFDRPGLDDCLRISVGTPEENQRLLEVLASLGLEEVKP